MILNVCVCVVVVVSFLLVFFARSMHSNFTIRKAVPSKCVAKYNFYSKVERETCQSFPEFFFLGTGSTPGMVSTRRGGFFCTAVHIVLENILLRGSSNNSVQVSHFTWSQSQHSDSEASPRSTPVLHGSAAHSRRRHLRTQPLWAPPARVSLQKVLQKLQNFKRYPKRSNFHALTLPSWCTFNELS